VRKTASLSARLDDKPPASRLSAWEQPIVNTSRITRFRASPASFLAIFPLPRDVANVRYFGANERSPDDSIDRARVIDRRIEATCRAFICEMAENDRR